ncbi:MAG TPA: Gfo/Idh/MocA family oxidoreductase [Pyrinomonadaceae bacterium]|jgi:predicted dehydrogenase|nr:Gfo/Idh/MocA family oxidoreductase [Pyrinomonadaceae bacterium]
MTTIHKVKWGILGVANIAVKKVIPAMQAGRWSEITAIASRDLSKAQNAAQQLNIPRAYGSYEELLADRDIEAIYNPLPNNLHVQWTIKAAQAGKHLLCEKPISMTVAEARPLLTIRDQTGVRIEEAFMVRTNPQWVATLNMIKEGRIGEVRTVTGYFSYNNQDLKNIRNIRETGGGGLMDIGCYMIFFSRLIFGAEPRRVVSLIDEHPVTKTDILTSALLEFPSGHASFSCGTRMTPYQRVQIVATKGRIEVQIPVNAPPDQPCKVFMDDGTDLTGGSIQTLEFEPCDQYTVQGDLFSQAIRENKEPVLSLEDSIRNMAVIEAVFRSAKTGKWEIPSL